MASSGAYLRATQGHGTKYQEMSLTVEMQERQEGLYSARSCRNARVYFPTRSASTCALTSSVTGLLAAASRAATASASAVSAAAAASSAAAAASAAAVTAAAAVSDAAVEASSAAVLAARAASRATARAAVARISSKSCFCCRQRSAAAWASITACSVAQP